MHKIFIEKQLKTSVKKPPRAGKYFFLQIFYLLSPTKGFPHYLSGCFLHNFLHTLTYPFGVSRYTLSTFFAFFSYSTPYQLIEHPSTSHNISYDTNYTSTAESKNEASTTLIDSDNSSLDAEDRQTRLIENLASLAQTPKMMFMVNRKFVRGPKGSKNMTR